MRKIIEYHVEVGGKLAGCPKTEQTARKFAAEENKSSGLQTIIYRVLLDHRRVVMQVLQARSDSKV